MTLVHDKFVLNIQLADQAGNPASLKLDLNYADWAALNTAVGAGDIAQILTDLDAVLTAAIVGYTVGEKFVDDTTKYGTGGSEVENLALLTCGIDGEIGKYATLRIPSPGDGVFEASTGPGRNIVDTTYTPLLTWLEHFSADGECLVSDGEQISDPAVAGNFKGKRIHRASRKG